MQAEGSDYRGMRTLTVEETPKRVGGDSYCEGRIASVAMEPPQTGVSGERSTQARSTETELQYAGGSGSRETRTPIATGRPLEAGNVQTLAVEVVPVRVWDSGEQWEKKLAVEKAPFLARDNGGPGKLVTAVCGLPQAVEITTMSGGGNTISYDLSVKVDGGPSLTTRPVMPTTNTEGEVGVDMQTVIVKLSSIVFAEGAETSRRDCIVRSIGKKKRTKWKQAVVRRKLRKAGGVTSSHPAIVRWKKSPRLLHDRQRERVQVVVKMHHPWKARTESFAGPTDKARRRGLLKGMRPRAWRRKGGRVTSAGKVRLQCEKSQGRERLCCAYKRKAKVFHAILLKRYVERGPAGAAEKHYRYINRFECLFL